ncbi:MAG: glycosyltransferase [Phormidesmis sp.]
MNTQTFEPESVRVFIGSSPRNLIEEKVFCYTLKKYTSSPLDIYIINGQNGSATRLLTGEVKTLPPGIIERIPGATAFSMARWAIPQWCDYQGKAIYCDSDQIALADITELWDFDLKGNMCAAVPVKQAKVYKHYTDQVLQRFLTSEDDHYLASVMLFDCEQASDWSLKSLIELMDQKQFTLPELMFLSAPLRRYFDIVITALPREWNHLDVVDADSKIVHFTDLTSQPWKFHHNAVSDLWEHFFLATLSDGALSVDEVKAARKAGYISQRIQSLAVMPHRMQGPVNRLWRGWSAATFLSIKFFSDRIQALTSPARSAARSVARRLRSQVKRLTNAHS